jgi:hypothetical protein
MLAHALRSVAGSPAAPAMLLTSLRSISSSLCAQQGEGWSPLRGMLLTEQCDDWGTRAPYRCSAGTWHLLLYLINTCFSNPLAPTLEAATA